MQEMIGLNRFKFSVTDIWLDLFMTNSCQFETQKEKSTAQT